MEQTEKEIFVFDKVIIEESICLIGFPIFNERPFKDLQIGDMVTHIGYGGYKSGGVTSTARLAEFRPAAEYAGRIDLCHPYDETQQCNYIGFRLPKGGIAGMKGRERPAYMLFIYSEDEQELYVPKLTGAGPGIFIYQAKFKKA
jgi:hypothetical protein